MNVSMPARAVPVALITALAVGLAACEAGPTSPELLAPGPASFTHGSGPFVVQSFDAARSFTSSGGASFSFAVGTPYTYARSLLAATFPDITITPGVATITPAALDDADIFFLASYSVELSEEEVCALETFVNAGGALIEARNLNSRPALFGTTPGPWYTTARMTTVASTELTWLGPYGGFSTLFTGFAYTFATIGDAEILSTQNISPYGPTILQLREDPAAGRAGRAVFIGDEEIFMNGAESGAYAGKLNLHGSNRQFLKNAIHWLADAPGMPAGTSFAHCAPVTPVAIDIKPGSTENPVQPRAANGVIPVAVFTADGFDATTIDVASLAFGPGGAGEAHGRLHVEDVDRDGDDDVVLHFRTGDTGLACGDVDAILTGATTAGQAFQGSDTVRILGCGG